MGAMVVRDRGSVDPLRCVFQRPLSPLDAVAVTIALAVILVLAVTASVIPARRAARIDATSRSGRVTARFRLTNRHKQSCEFAQERVIQDRRPRITRASSLRP